MWIQRREMCYKYVAGRALFFFFSQRLESKAFPVIDATGAYYVSPYCQTMEITRDLSVNIDLT